MTSPVRWTPGLLAGLPAMSDQGARSATDPINVTVELSRPEPSAEAAAIQAIYTPGSATFHQFFTPSSFADRFGVTQAAYSSAVSFGTSEGLSLVTSSAARDHLQFTGTVGQAEATFGTDIHNFTYKGTAYFANTSAPLFPSGLGLTGIFGLESVHRAHLDSVTSLPAQGGCRPQLGECLGNVTPQDMWSIYHQPATDTGQNQKIAIFGEGATDYIIADLRQYESENHLPVIPTKVNHADGPTADYTSTDGDGEWQLDTQSSTGMAPDATELDFEWGTDLNDASTLNVLNEFIADPTLYNASASYSECEPTPGDLGGAEGPVFAPVPPDVAANAELYYSTDAYTKAYENQLIAAVGMGKTLFSSSGDNGGSCGALPADLNGVSGEGTTGVGYPASSPNAVGVGGTVLYGSINGATAPASNATRVNEYGWNDSGGGPSQVFPEPAYQKIPATATTEATNVPCMTDLTGAVLTNGPTCRKDPDVSAISGDIATNGYAIVDDKKDSATGGTSLSSPLMLGLWTRVVSAYGNHGPGFANYSFYAHPADFFDPGGSTATMASNNQPWVSGAGYDYVTGLGVPDVAKFMTDVAGRTTPGAAPTDAAVTTPPSLPEVGAPVLLLGGGLALGGALLARRRRRARVS